MDTSQLLDSDWPLVLSLLPNNLDETAKQFGALQRKRKVQEAQTLLRLGLAYSFGGLSLRETAAWSQMSQLADLSDVAVLKRLRNAADWFGWLVAKKLAERTTALSATPSRGRVRLFDATTVNRPASKGTDWRLHVGFDLQNLCLDYVEITAPTGGETLTRFALQPGDIALCDRGYAHRAGICAVAAQQADVIVRLNWHNVPLQNRDATPFDLLSALRGLPEGAVLDTEVQTAPDPKADLPAVAGRLVALRKSKEAAEAAREKIKKQARKQGRTSDPRTLEAAAYIFVFTTLSCEQITGSAVLDLYRFRWQIELAFKQMKGILFLRPLA